MWSCIKICVEQCLISHLSSNILRHLNIYWILAFCLWLIGLKRGVKLRTNKFSCRVLSYHLQGWQLWVANVLPIPRPLEPSPILPSPALGGNTGITFQFAPSGSSAYFFKPCTVFKTTVPETQTAAGRVWECEEEVCSDCYDGQV
jgi:hypothetical protein